MQKLTLLILLFLNISIYAQAKFNSKDLKVTHDDLNINVYEKDSTANALVLYEYGNSYFEKYNLNLKTEIKRKTKILNRNGFKKADIIIYLFNNEKKSEKVENIEATTYNIVDGKIRKTELNDKNIFIEKYNEDYSLVKFTLPNIKVGSVITYSYTLTSPFIYKYKGWEFQSSIPKLYSEYNTSIPAIYNYNIWKNGDLKIDIINEQRRERCVEGGGGTYADCFDGKYIMKSIPSFVEESYMSSNKNFISRLDYELASAQGFTGIVKHFNRIDIDLKTSKNFGLQMKKGKVVKDLIKKELLKNIDDLEKAKTIYSFIQNNFAWNGSYGIVFEDNSIKKIVDNKSGNIYEVNLLLYNLLKANKIDCKPVLLSTRENGLINKKKPKISGLNYLIVQATILGKKYYLDASDKHLSFNQISFSCLNQYGRLLT